MGDPIWSPRDHIRHRQRLWITCSAQPLSGLCGQLDNGLATTWIFQNGLQIMALICNTSCLQVANKLSSCWNFLLDLACWRDRRRQNGLIVEQRTATEGDSQEKAWDSFVSLSMNRVFILETAGDNASSVYLVLSAYWNGEIDVTFYPRHRVHRWTHYQYFLVAARKRRKSFTVRWSGSSTFFSKDPLLHSDFSKEIWSPFSRASSFTFL